MKPRPQRCYILGSFKETMGAWITQEMGDIDWEPDLLVVKEVLALFEPEYLGRLEGKPVYWTTQTPRIEHGRVPTFVPWVVVEGPHRFHLRAGTVGGNHK